MRDIVGLIGELIGSENIIIYYATQMKTSDCLTFDISLQKAQQLEGILYCLNEIIFKAH